MSVPRIVSAAILCAATLASAAFAADACRYVPVATLQFRAAGDLWQPTVDGSIDGHPAVVLVDTGMWASMLLKQTADKYGMPSTSAGTRTRGVGGATPNYAVQVQDFSVGDVHSGKATMDALAILGFKPRFDAIAGADFLLQMDLEIALAEKRLRFFRARDCADTYLAYWSPDAMEIPFTGTRTSHPNPRLFVEVNGVRLEAMIDTGAPLSSMTRQSAERAGIRLDGPNVVRDGVSSGVGAAQVARWIAEVDTFTLGSETILHAHLGVRDAEPQGKANLPDMLLGADFLRAHRVLIAMSQKRFYISYLGGDVFGRAAFREAK